MLPCQALFCSRRQAWCLALAPRVGYHRALSRRRTVWFSEEFLHLHPQLARFVLARMGASSHRWSGVADRETFAQRAKGNKRAKTMYLGLVSKHQLRDEDAQSAKLLAAKHGSFISGRHGPLQNQHGHVCKVKGAR